MKKRLLVITVLAISFLGCQNNKLLYKDTQVLMGTYVEVISPKKQAGEIVFNEVKRIENLLSKYKENSEISQLNKNGVLRASPDTFFIMQKAKQFWLDSNGAFDATVGPVMDIWGFSDKQYRLPSDNEIKNALKKVGFDKIILNNSGNLIKFKVPGMKVDLGGIAKGYALDCAVKKLNQAGVKDCLINAGGQIYCLGARFGKHWAIGIQDPRRGGYLSKIELFNQAIATSGDYQQYFEKDKKRYSHIMDPKVGRPVDSGVISVTIIAPDALTADALSTAVFVLGKEKSKNLLNIYSKAKAEIIEERKNGK